MKKRAWFAKPIYSVVPRGYLLSRVSVSVYKFTVLNYSLRVVYHTIIVFIMRIWVNDKTTQKWVSEDVYLDEI